MSPLTEPTKLILKKDSVAATDTNIREVSLLLHGNGANGSTTVTDSSLNPKTVTVVGNAQISTAVADPFGNSTRGVLAFDGNGDYLRVPDPQVADFAGGDFTVEAWVYSSVTPASKNIMGNYVSGTSNTRTLVIQTNSSSKLQGVVYYGNGASFGAITSASALSANQWTHVALVRNLATITLFAGGLSAGTFNIGANILNTAANPLIVGAEELALYWNGYIDELRITKGVARYTSNFTPPTAPFPDF